ncbi:MAG: translation elongation factor Ts [Deltaproteobacteria bacterium]|nr:translation elongation factor Ts [Deltaproteobacteria bacterium]MBI3078522.1 translation elongation factor Ts [Deltaproteobacteria bacterium]
MQITAAQVRTLRDKTGAGVLDCRKALEEAGGDEAGAIDLLRQKGMAAAAKKAGRSATEGAVGSYIHAGGKIGVLVEVNCETDFVAKTPEFQELVKAVAMQVAAASPQFVRREDVPEAVLEKEREIYRAQAREQKKPDRVVEKIVEGKLERYFSEACLLEQPYIRDPDRTVKELLNELIGKIGENIVIRRFARYQLGEGG